MFRITLVFCLLLATTSVIPAADPVLAKNPTVLRLVPPAKSAAQAEAILAQQAPNFNPLFGQPNQGPGVSRPTNNSQQLIDVIQRVIAPPTWDVNGGQGAVRYYGPAQSLVVRQTSEIHEQFRRILPKLRQ